VKNALLSDAIRELTRQTGLSFGYPPASSHLPVELSADNITVASALNELLLDKGLDVSVGGGDFVQLTPRAQAPLVVARIASQAGGSITGRVTDADTKRPLSGVAVLLDHTLRGATTNDSGVYRFTNIAPGTYTVLAKRLGYTPDRASVSIVGNEVAVADLALTKSASVLDQVVVTGSVAPTEVKTLPTPITVITAQDINDQHLTRLDEVFRTSVPGTISWDQGALDFTNSITVRGTNSLILGQNTIKIYIDGIEASNDLFAVVDVNSIDHVEIIRGPEASTIYGSDASGGVMEVFTKKGDLGQRQLRLDATVAEGVVQSPFRKNGTLGQQYTLGINGGTGDVGYNVGGSYTGAGSWAPGYFASVPSIFGGARLQQDRLTVDLTARYTSRTFSDPFVPRPPGLPQGPFGSPSFTDNDVRNETYGVGLGYSATSWWDHHLVLGFDRTSQEYYNTHAQSNGLYDVFEFHDEKASVAYNTSVHLRPHPLVSADIIGGIAYYRANGDEFAAPGAHSNVGYFGSDSSSPPYLGRVIGTNTGVFGQARLGVADALFVTVGARAEHNSNFGTDYGTVVSPRVGAAYVQPIGPITIKARGSYGEGIRPPALGAGESQPNIGLIANPKLGPEKQVGGDGGVDLSIGTHVAVSGTYYRQTAIGLIDQVYINATANPPTFQYQNVGRVKNSGWEFQAQYHADRFAISAQYSITNSTVETLGPSYSGDLKVGDRLLAIPRNSAGATLTYSPLPRTALHANFTYMANWNNYNWFALLPALYGVTPYAGSTRDYWMRYPAIAKIGIGVDQAIVDHLTGFVNVDNVGDNDRYEFDNLAVVPGRRTMVGLRLSY
jgi:outer membrane receptor protein involved in Fe transport